MAEVPDPNEAARARSATAQEQQEARAAALADIINDFLLGRRRKFAQFGFDSHVSLVTVRGRQMVSISDPSRNVLERLATVYQTKYHVEWGGTHRSLLRVEL